MTETELRMMWELSRIREALTELKEEQKAMSLAVSNLTNAVVSLSSKMETLADGFAALKTELDTELQTVLNSQDETAVQAAADQINNSIGPRMDSVIASLKTESTAVAGLAAQMPTGSAAPTTGATGTAGAGTTVVGVPTTGVATTGPVVVTDPSSGAPVLTTGVTAVAPVTTAGSTAGTSVDNNSTGQAADGKSTGSAGA